MTVPAAQPPTVHHADIGKKTHSRAPAHTTAADGTSRRSRGFTRDRRSSVRNSGCDTPPRYERAATTRHGKTGSGGQPIRIAAGAERDHPSCPEAERKHRDSEYRQVYVGATKKSVGIAKRKCSANTGFAPLHRWASAQSVHSLVYTTS